MLIREDIQDLDVNMLKQILVFLANILDVYKVNLNIKFVNKYIKLL